MRSAHDRLHVDVDFPDDMYRRITEQLDSPDFEDMYFILFRLAAGDDIRRLRTDAKKFFKGEDIFHWLPSKDDYRKVAEAILCFCIDPVKFVLHRIILRLCFPVDIIFLACN